MSQKLVTFSPSPYHRPLWQDMTKFEVGATDSNDRPVHYDQKDILLSSSTFDVRLRNRCSISIFTLIYGCLNIPRIFKR